MHKSTENQRKYMARRVNEEFDNAVSFIKQQEAVTIKKIADKAETQYKKTLGISKEVNGKHQFNGQKKLNGKEKG